MRVRPLALLFLLVLVAGCDLGSRSYEVPFYKFDVTWKQVDPGALRLEGETDLPDGTLIEALVTTSRDPVKAADGAVLNGSTLSPGATPVKKGKFALTMDHALAETCHRQPPCGPFPAGTYYILVDAKASTDTSADVTTYRDKRILSETHGYTRFPGLEIQLKAQLKEIRLSIDENGHQVNPLQAPLPGPSTAPVPSPTAPR